jgi:cobalt-zinc-cadmium efflux system protein
LSSSEVALTAHLLNPDKTFSDQNHKEVAIELDKRFGISHVTIQIEGGEGDDCRHLKSC